VAINFIFFYLIIQIIRKKNKNKKKKLLKKIIVPNLSFDKLKQLQIEAKELNKQYLTSPMLSKNEKKKLKYKYPLNSHHSFLLKKIFQSINLKKSNK
jgi:hypothetical protein